MFHLYMDDVRVCPDGWRLARTIEEAQLLLATGEVDRCSLDHDMGACLDCKRAGTDIGNMETDETTFCHWCPHVLDGTSLARWMVATGHWPKQKPTVHSKNPNGRKRMEGIIDKFFGSPAMGLMF